MLKRRCFRQAQHTDNQWESALLTFNLWRPIVVARTRGSKWKSALPAFPAGTNSRLCASNNIFTGGIPEQR